MIEQNIEIMITMNEEREIKKFYAACPVCAHKLCKGESGTKVDIVCPRCKNIISISINDDKVDTVLIEKKKN